MKTIHHTDTEAQRRTMKSFSLCLCGEKSPMRILFLTHSFNSLAQRLHVELARRGHEVSIEALRTMRKRFLRVSVPLW